MNVSLGLIAVKPHAAPLQPTHVQEISFLPGVQLHHNRRHVPGKDVRLCTAADDTGGFYCFYIFVEAISAQARHSIRSIRRRA